MKPLLTIAETPEILRKDVMECLAELILSDTQKNRRTLTRAMFAEIEASMYLFRQSSLDPMGGAEIELNESEKALLKEEDYEISEKGMVRVRPYFGKFLPTFRFVVAMFIKANCLQTAIDYSTGGWDALQKAIKIRNRLTHPRVPIDLEVTDDELDIVAAAYEFQRGIFLKLLEDNLDRVQQKIRDSESHLQDTKIRMAEIEIVIETGLGEIEEKKAEFDAISLQLESEDLSEAERDRLSKELQNKLAELKTLSEEFHRLLSTL